MVYNDIFLIKVQFQKCAITKQMFSLKFTVLLWWRHNYLMLSDEQCFIHRDGSLFLNVMIVRQRLVNYQFFECGNLNKRVPDDFLELNHVWKQTKNNLKRCCGVSLFIMNYQTKLTPKRHTVANLKFSVCTKLFITTLKTIYLQLNEYKKIVSV